MRSKIILLAGNGDSSLYMYNGLKDEYEILNVIIENPVSKKKFLQRRVKKLGIITVFGQLLFQVILVKILQFFSKHRIEEIKNENNLSLEGIPESKLIKVQSVNSNECRYILNTINPDIIIVNGTRIISKKILNTTNAVFVNTHAGITPKYRGVHGAYWALANNDIENCGVTVHFVDEGIDTGGVLYQRNIEPIKKDNFTTYTYLQIAEGIHLMKKALNDIKNNNVLLKNIKIESKLWSHPTIWKYILLRISKGIK